jgi:transcriptional regulator with XRE-family HTH domain
MTLSDRLREAMADAGINQKDLAAACGVKPPSVNGWLSGRAKFLRGENLLLAAKALNVSDQWLATGKLPKERTTPAESHSQSVRLDPEIVRDVARALQEVFAELDYEPFNLAKDAELFVELYQRVRERGESSSVGNLVWLGTRIKERARLGAPSDERSKGLHGKGAAPGDTRSRRNKA